VNCALGINALTASRLDALRVKKQKADDFPGRTDWPHTLAKHTAMSERPGGPGGAGSPTPSPCCHSVAERSGPLQASHAVEALVRATARSSGWSRTPRAWWARAARAAEEECQRILENRKVAAGARRQQGRTFRHASRRTFPIISALAALRGGGSGSGDELPRWAGGGRQAWATRACIRLSERASSQPPADERACPISSIRNLSWPSQWRFQISAQIHPKFKLASQSVDIYKVHPKLGGPNT
jgi:hypothetical protein